MLIEFLVLVRRKTVYVTQCTGTSNIELSDNSLISARKYHKFYERSRKHMILPLQN